MARTLLPTMRSRMMASWRSSSSMVTSLPLSCRLANADAALEIARHRLEMAEQRTLLEQDPGNDAMKADVMARTFRQWRERTRISTDLPPQARNAMHARNRAVQMARGVRHAMALAAGEKAGHVMQAIAVTVAGGTNKGRLADPWQRRVPDDRDALLLLAIVQQNSGPLCRELAGFFTPLEPCHDAIGERA